MTTATHQAQPVNYRSEHLPGIIANQVFLEAITALQNDTLCSIENDRITFAKNTDKEDSITRLPDGALQVTDPKLWSVRLQPPSFLPTLQRFCYEVQPLNLYPTKIQAHYSNTIENLARRYFDPVTAKSYVRHSPSNSARPITEAIARCLKKVYTTLNNLNISQSPQPAMLAQLRDFLGPNAVEQTLRIVGSRANLAQHNLVRQHPQAIDQAHRENPNATLFWITHVNPNPNPQTGAAGPTAASIIQQARNLLANAANSAPHRMGPETFNTYWKIFSQLDLQTLQESQPDPNALFHLTRAVVLAGQPPDPIATAHILHHHQQPAINHNPGGERAFIPARMAAAFIRQLNSIGPDRPNQELDRQTIARQFLAIHETLTYNQTTDYFRKLVRHLASTDATPRPDWLDWTAPLPRSQRQLTATQLKRLTDPPTPFQNPDQEKATMAQTLSLLQGPTGRKLLELTAQQYRLTEEPGQSFTIRKNNSRKYLVCLQKLPDRSVRYEIGAANPRPPRFPSPQPQPLPSQGAGLNALTNLALNHLKANWPEQGAHLAPQPPNRRNLTAALHLWQTNPNNLLDDRIISKRLDQTLGQLLDQDLLALNARHAPYQDLRTYNITAKLRDHVEHLQQTNPGILQWAYAHLPPDAELHHPGQLVTWAKQHLKEQGLHRSHWKHTVRTPTETMVNLTQHNDPATAAAILNILGQTNRHPPREVIDLINQQYNLPDRYPPGDRTDLHDRNNAALATALVKELGRREGEGEPDPTEAQQETWRNQLQDVRDYVRNATYQGDSIHSQTWNGLCKQSHRWHQLRRQQPYIANWRQHLKLNKNRYLAWTSLVNKTRIDDLTVTPLDDEYLLLAESLAMNHCVTTYAPACRAGEARIFSITDADQHRVATLQISQNPAQGWHNRQLRGPKNHPVAEPVRRVADRLAQMYQDAYARQLNATAADPHQTWSVPATRDQIEIEP